MEEFKKQAKELQQMETGKDHKWQDPKLNLEEDVVHKEVRLSNATGVCNSRCMGNHAIRLLIVFYFLLTVRESTIVMSAESSWSVD